MWLGALGVGRRDGALRGGGHDVYPLTLTGVGDRAPARAGRRSRHAHRGHRRGWSRRTTSTTWSWSVTATAACRSARPRCGCPSGSARVVYVDSGPLPDGARQLDHVGPERHEPIDDGDAVPPRPWDPADDPVLLAGLDADALALLRHARTTAPVRLGRRSRWRARDGERPADVADRVHVPAGPDRAR